MNERAQVGVYLMKGRAKGVLHSVGVADRMRNAGVGHACNVVDVRQRSCRGFVARHDGAVAIAHHFNVLALVIRVRIAVVRPQKRADFHLVACGRYGLVSVGVHAHDLAGPEFVFVVIAQLVVRERLERDAVALVVFADQHRQAAHLVARGEDFPVVGHDQQGERSRR